MNQIKNNCVVWLCQFSFKWKEQANNRVNYLPPPPAPPPPPPSPTPLSNNARYVMQQTKFLIVMLWHSGSSSKDGVVRDLSGSCNIVQSLAHLSLYWNTSYYLTRPQLGNEAVQMRALILRICLLFASRRLLLRNNPTFERVFSTNGSCLHQIIRICSEYYLFVNAPRRWSFENGAERDVIGSLGTTDGATQFPFSSPWLVWRRGLPVKSSHSSVVLSLRHVGWNSGNWGLWRMAQPLPCTLSVGVLIHTVL